MNVNSAVRSAPRLSLQQGQQMLRNLPKRPFFRWLPWVIGGVTMVLGSIPLLGAWSGLTSFIGDRMRTSTDRDHELKERAKYYAPQIASQLGIREDQVDVHAFRKAGEINPQIGRLYREPIAKKKEEDKGSLISSVAVGAAGAIGLGGLGEAAKKGGMLLKTAHVGAQVAKTGAGLMAGGAIAGALANEDVDAQGLIEALEKTLIEADMQGVDRRSVINPQLIFIVRVAQDEVLAKQIKEKYKKPLHKMSPDEINRVIATEPKIRALATAAEREATAIANSDLDVRELGAAPPNLNAGFSSGLQRGQGGSQLDKLNARRAAEAQARNGGAVTA